MKIIELLDVEKAIKIKKQELEELRREVELLNTMIESKTNQEGKVDVSNVYIFRKRGNNVFSFVRRQEMNYTSNYTLYDIFSDELVSVYSQRAFKSVIHNAYSELFLDDYIISIKEAFPEVNVYVDGNVPKLLLQKLYYRANGIDEKVLKRGVMKD